MLFCRRCDFGNDNRGKKVTLPSAVVASVYLGGPSTSSVYVHLILEMSDTLEMTDCKCCMHHLNFYKRAGI